MPNAQWCGGLLLLLLLLQAYCTSLGFSAPESHEIDHLHLLLLRLPLRSGAQPHLDPRRFVP